LPKLRVNFMVAAEGVSWEIKRRLSDAIFEVFGTDVVVSAVEGHDDVVQGGDSLGNKGRRRYQKVYKKTW
jgi:hypothetical protein